MELHPFHIIITESLEYLLDEILMSFPFKRRPRLKAGDQGRQIVSMSSTCEMEASSSGIRNSSCMLSESTDQSGDDCQSTCMLDGFIESRTFICESPQLRNADSVVQSTTEVVSHQSEVHYANYRGL